MNNWKPTHRTRPGVEVRLEMSPTGLLCLSWDGSSDLIASFDESEAAKLFEPIPQPVMVEIPIDTARTLRHHWPLDSEINAILSVAIGSAERERDRLNRDDPHHPD